jgi:hypothetical protein
MPRRLSILVLVLAATALPWLTAVSPALACSCMQPNVKDYVGVPDKIIFVGRGVKASGDEMRPDVTVAVESWLQGPGAQAVLLTKGGNGADCGLTLTPGTRWLVFTEVPPPDEPLRPTICSPTVSLDDPNGEKVLADVLTMLGPLPSSPPPSASPAAPAPTLIPTPPPKEAETGVDSAVAAPALLAGTVLAAGALFGVVLLLGRRKPRVDD